MTAIQTHDAQIAAAQTRFMQAVSQAIAKLISECGYSRERATATLLRELGRGEGSSVEQDADEHALFDTMTSFRLGVEDASHALVVSRALERVMKERGLSAVEAINDLSSKLNTTTLVSCQDGQQELEPPAVASSSSRPSSPQLQRSTPTLSTTNMSNDRVSTHVPPRKGRKVATAKTKNATKKAPKNVTKSSSRKRPSRERADSVTEAVEQKAKKARLSPEDSPEVEAADAPNGTIVVRAKRNAATLHEQQQQEPSMQSNVI